MNFIFIYGPPAAGKLTIAKELSKQTKYKLFHNHLTYDTAYSLFGDDVYSIAFKECCEKLRLTAIKEAVKYDIDVIFTFVYDHKSDSDFVQNLKSIIEDGKGKIHFISLHPSLDIIKQRVTQDSRKVFKKVSTKEELKEFTEYYDIYSTIPNVQSLKIDNSNLKPIEVVEKIIKSIQ